jgi:hypothetical protein
MAARAVEAINRGGEVVAVHAPPSGYKAGEVYPEVLTMWPDTLSEADVAALQLEKSDSRAWRNEYQQQPAPHYLQGADTVAISQPMFDMLRRTGDLLLHGDPASLDRGMFPPVPIPTPTGTITRQQRRYQARKGRK